MQTKRLALEDKKEKNRTYTRQCADIVLKNILQKIEEINSNKEFIYCITKAVLFGSYINSNKERIGDLDIAIYIELKNKEIPEDEQNWNRSKSADRPVPFLMRFIYGREEVFKYIKGKKKILQLGFKEAYIFFEEMGMLNI